MCVSKIEFSFIIPAHNCELTLKNTLNSLCDDIENAEKINNSEILIVENGSKDGTLNFIKNYIKYTNYNIRLLNSEQGVSNARNMGIKNAIGQFIIFLDADDIWLPGSLKKICVDLKKYQADLYCYSFLKGKLEIPYNQNIKIIHTENHLDNKNGRIWLLSKPTYRMQVWAKIFKKEIITKNNIYFDENLAYSEDSEFLIRYSKCCKIFLISSFPIYKYVLSSDSAMRSSNNKRINSYINSMSISNEYIKNDEEEIKNVFYKYVLFHLNIILVRDIFCITNKKVNLLSSYKEMRQLLKKEIFKSSIKKIKLLDCFSINLIPEFFMKLHLIFLVPPVCYLKSYINLRKEN